MNAGARPKPLVIALAVVAIAIIAYWGYSAHKKRAFDATTVAAIQDSSQRLRAALTLAAGPPEAVTMSTAEKIGTDAGEVDRRLQALRHASTTPDMALADAADSYLLTVRELLKRIAGTQRHRLMLAESTAALRDHLRIDTRTGAWVSEAVRSKARMDKDFRGLRIDSEMVDQLLESFHRSQDKIVPFVDSGAFIDEKLVADARQRTAATLKKAAVETKSFRLH